MATTTTTTTAPEVPTTLYSWAEPNEKLRWTDHFSSLLFGGSWVDTLLELALLCVPLALWAALGSAADVPGSMQTLELAGYFWANAVYVGCLYPAHRDTVSCSLLPSITKHNQVLPVAVCTGCDASTTPTSKEYGLLSPSIVHSRLTNISSKKTKRCAATVENPYACLLALCLLILLRRKPNGMLV